MSFFILTLLTVYSFPVCFWRDQPLLTICDTFISAFYHPPLWDPFTHKIITVWVSYFLSYYMFIFLSFSLVWQRLAHTSRTISFSLFLPLTLSLTFNSSIKTFFVHFVFSRYSSCWSHLKHLLYCCSCHLLFPLSYISSHITHPSITDHPPFLHYSFLLCFLLPQLSTSLDCQDEL